MRELCAQRHRKYGKGSDIKTKVGVGEMRLQVKEWMLAAEKVEEALVSGYQGLTTISEAPKLCSFAAIVL